MVPSRYNRRRRLLLLKKKLLLLSAVNAMPELFKIRSSPRWWVHPLWQKRKTEGDFDTAIKIMTANEGDYFRKYFRMTEQTFDQLAELVTPSLEKFSRFRETLSPKLKLAATLRYLANGDSFASISLAFRIGLSTTPKVIYSTCEALWDVLRPMYLQNPTVENWKETSSLFSKLWQFPLCCGAVDGKHVVIQCPPRSRSMFPNYKGTFSTVLMATADAEYKFLYVDIGAYGCSSDRGIFKASSLGKALEDGTLTFPEPTKLPRSNTTAPYVFIGDEVSHLKVNFMRPYPADQLTPERRIFNYRLSRARRCVENAFGILSSRWKVYRRPINCKPENVDKIVQATVVLHNFLRTIEGKAADMEHLYAPPGYLDFEDSLGNVIPGDWRTQLEQAPAQGLQNIEATAARNFTSDAYDTREAFVRYFNSKEGMIPWQYELPGVQGFVQKPL